MSKKEVNRKATGFTIDQDGRRTTVYEVEYDDNTAELLELENGTELPVRRKPLVKSDS